MQKLMGYMRKAITEYNMLEDGDKVAVGVSGGKDSVALLTALAWMRSYLGIDYSLVAITLDPSSAGYQGIFPPLKSSVPAWMSPTF